SAFLAGLAELSQDHGRTAARAGLVPELPKRTAAAVAAGRGPPGHLAALRRLTVTDAAAAGADPVPLVVQQIGACFQGRLPMAFADHLLADWRAAWLTRGNRVRLRILLCDRAFEAGFEV